MNAIRHQILAVIVCLIVAADDHSCRASLLESETQDYASNQYINLNEVFNTTLEGAVADRSALPVEQSFQARTPVPSDIVLIKTDSVWRFAIVEARLEHDTYTVLQSDVPASTLTIARSAMRELLPFWRIVYSSLAIKLFPNVFFDTLSAFLAQASKNGKRSLLASIVSSGTRIVVIGDLHGDFDSLGRNLSRVYADQNFFNKDGTIAPGCLLVMLGDYADRGAYGSECWYLLAQMALQNPDRVILIRGNHETQKFSQLKKYYTAYLKEWEKKFDVHLVDKWWPTMLEIFEALPLALLLGHKTPGCQYYDFILFCHGGYATTWDPKLLLTSAIEQQRNLILHVSTEQETEFLNNDFIGLAESSKTQGHVRLHKEGEHITHQQMRKYLRTSGNDISWQHPYQYCLRAIMRGHQHLPGGIVQLAPVVESWRTLHSKLVYEVDQYAVYGFTSCPVIYGKEDAFGILLAAPNGRWYLQPYIYPVP